ncbi:MAG TPA: fasciclin domain-containing protein [Spirosoma sp.]|nr:fasciclin domain-containing protein [Spirosoma sp.]
MCCSNIITSAFTDNSELTTVQGGKINVKVSGGKVTGKANGTNASNVTQSDIALSNGIMHIIDRVLLPQ